MFKKLRNRLILINLGVTTVVIAIVFSGIYLASARSAEMRAPMFNFYVEGVTDDLENMMNAGIREERQAAAEQLLVTLVVSGLMIEATVAMVSYFMAEEAIKPVREAYEAQKVFIANASHEIKTPLAAIAANLEAADIHNNKWIANVETETAKLTELNKSLLTLARTDLVTTSKVEEVNLAELVEKNLRGFAPRMKGVKFVQRINLKGKVRTNAEDLVQILGILMDNAIKYCDKEISCELNAHQLVVENDGREINSEQLAHVFERFYQADKSSEGVGLGLSIAKSLAERNGWILEAFSGDRKTKFVLSF